MSENRKPFETFAHYKVGKGFATLAVSVDEGHARVGISYCHPRDGINKSKGRSIARARRDVDSTFGFDFRRKNDVRLGDQLRAEFERFVVKTGKDLAMVKIYAAEGVFDDSPRVGAPPWAIHSLNRELRKRARLAKTVEATVDGKVFTNNVAPEIVDNDSVPHSCSIC